MPKRLTLVACSWDKTWPTVEGGFGLSLSKGPTMGSRNPRRMLLAPVTVTSCTVIGVMVWSAIW